MDDSKSTRRSSTSLLRIGVKMFQRKERNNRRKKYTVAGEISFSLMVRLVSFIFKVAWRSCCDVAVKGKRYCNKSLMMMTEGANIRQTVI
jgi:hypothetical protein